MTARDEGVSGRSRVHVHGRLTAQPQRDVGPDAPAEGALSTGRGAVHVRRVPLALRALAPVVTPVNVTAGQVHPRLTLLQAVAAGQTGEGQCAEAHGALGPGGVELLPQSLQVPERGRPLQALPGAPQQGRSTQVNQGAVSQRTALPLRLQDKIQTF